MFFVIIDILCFSYALYPRKTKAIPNIIVITIVIFTQYLCLITGFDSDFIWSGKNNPITQDSRIAHHSTVISTSIPQAQLLWIVTITNPTTNLIIDIRNTAAELFDNSFANFSIVFGLTNADRDNMTSSGPISWAINIDDSIIRYR